ncbi:MAG TPA: hypothetical protein VMD02_02990 [Candidatus Omnitrophota bacterium]|nr:hypothetical protein [Candidatus Omnitrophota bacterium]
MKKAAVWVAVFMSFIFAGQAFCLEDAIIGGVRGGISFGVKTEYHFVQSVALRFGLEGTTGENPLILSAGAHFLNFPLKNGNPSPWFLGAGVVGYSGKSTQSGLSLSLIYDPLEKSDQYFGEIGFDFINSPRIMAEIGYYVIPDAVWQ